MAQGNDNTTIGNGDSLFSNHTEQNSLSGLDASCMNDLHSGNLSNKNKRINNVLLDAKNLQSTNSLVTNFINNTSSSAIPSFTNSSTHNNRDRNDENIQPCLSLLTPKAEDDSMFQTNANTDLFASPESNIFESSIIDTPETPASPYFRNKSDIIPDVFSIPNKSPILAPSSKTDNVVNSSKISKSNRKYTRYPIKDETVKKFVLDSNLFKVKLNDKIGSGSNGYVYACELSEKNHGIDDNSSPFNIAIKIPQSKSQCRYLIKETKFAIKLRQYKNEWLQKHHHAGKTYYPFIDCFGLYYMNKDQFPLFNRKDELPCLLMNRMTLSLSQYIALEKKKVEKPSDLKIPLNVWLKLSNTLIDVLNILKDLKSVHCDIKTDNVLVQVYTDLVENEEEEENRLVFKMIDFSSSDEVESITECPSLTLQYTAPELLDYSLPEKERLPTYSTDLFSAGAVMLEAATGSVPYDKAGTDYFYLLSVVQKGDILNWTTPEDNQILENHPKVRRVIASILEERCDLEKAAMLLQCV